MKNEINIELRSEILEMVLILEQSINQLITVFLDIDNPNPKTIGYRSSSLDFISKLNLLSDLEILSKEEYSKLLLVMEFRNQFLHNINCNSFIVAVDLLGSDRGKHLLRFDDLNFEAEQEYRYNHAFKGLFVNCLDIIMDKYDKRSAKFEEKREVFTTVSDYFQYLLDTNDEIINEVMVMCMPHNGDELELSKFKLKVFSFITEHIDRSVLTDKYKKLRSQLETIDSIDIKKILK